ncbi:hypothetical protein QOT17_001205 [Balamuthia mandrillaris]
MGANEGTSSLDDLLKQSQELVLLLMEEYGWEASAIWGEENNAELFSSLRPPEAPFYHPLGDGDGDCHQQKEQVKQEERAMKTISPSHPTKKMERRKRATTVKRKYTRRKRPLVFHDNEYGCLSGVPTSECDSKEHCNLRPMLRQLSTTIYEQQPPDTNMAVIAATASTNREMVITPSVVAPPLTVEAMMRMDTLLSCGTLGIGAGLCYAKPISADPAKTSTARIKRKKNRTEEYRR